MASSKLSYQRLNQEIWFADEAPENANGRLKNLRFRRVHMRRRFKVKIPRLRRFLKRKSRLVKVVLNKVTPTPLKVAENTNKSFVRGYDYARHSTPRIA
ncbi:hypothetical protein ACJIZ3_015104 [Penstemon smallii]|uniref:Ribosomal protein L20 n=1 Tax=Penstemon smallii TaxID=265156 RepID=A0ABD3RT16_9LAMI